MCYFKAEFKRLFFSLWSVLLYLPVVTLTATLAIQTHFERHLFLSENLFIGVFLCFFAPILCVYSARATTDFEYTLCPPKKIALTKLSVVVLFVWSGLLPFILYIWFASSLSIREKCAATVAHLLPLLVAILFLSAVGLCLGSWIRKKYVYGLSFLLSLLFSPFFQLTGYDNAFGLNDRNRLALFDLLNLVKDRTAAYHFPVYDLIVERYQWANLVAFLALAALFFALLCLTASWRKRHRIKAGSVCTVGASLLVCVGAVVASFTLYPHYIEHDPINLSAKFVDRSRDDYRDLRVVRYEMQVDLCRHFQNDCTVRLKNTDDAPTSAPLAFKLDDCFRVESVSADGKAVAFRKTGDRLELPDLYPAGGAEMTLQIRYDGIVDYFDGVQVRNVFSDDRAACLPEVFAWYPRLETVAHKTTFSLSVTANQPVVSNLNGHRADNSAPVKTMQGDAETVYLLSGDYATISAGGKTVTCYRGYLSNPKAQTAIHDLLAFCQKDAVLYNTPIVPAIVEDSDEPENEKADAAHWAKFSYPPEQAKRLNTYLFAPFSYSNLMLTYAFDGAAILDDAYLYGSLLDGDKGEER